MGEFSIRLLVLAAIVGFVWWVLQPRYNFTILYHDGEVRITGLPQVQHANISRFLREDISLRRKVTIRGLRTRSGRLTVRFRGRIDIATKQRIRNFLMTIT